MRITLEIDDDLTQFIMKETRARIQAEAIRHALSDFVRPRKVEKLIAFEDKVKFRKDWTRTSRRIYWPVDFKTGRGDETSQLWPIHRKKLQAQLRNRTRLEQAKLA